MGSAGNVNLGRLLPAPVQRTAWWERVDRRALFHLIYLTTCFFLVAHFVRASQFMLMEAEDASDLYAANSGGGDSTRQLGFMLLALYGAAGLLDLWRERLRPRGVGGAVVMALLGWMLLSFAWSESPGAALSRLFGVAVLALVAMRIRLRFTALETIRGVTVAMLTFMVTGIVCEIALGTFKPWSTEYRFAGTTSPTEEGLHCSIIIMGAFCLRRFTAEKRLWTWVMVSAALLGLLSKARMANAGVLVAIGVVSLLSAKSWRQRWLITSGMGAFAALGAWLTANGLLALSSSALQLGRDSATSDTKTLNGRIPLWVELWKYVDAHWLVGVGFGSFWTSNHIEDFTEDQGWPISAAHSAYVDMLLSLGTVGFCLYCGSLLIGLGAGVRRLGRPGDIGAAYFSMLAVFVIWTGFTDSQPVYVTGALFFGAMLTFAFLLFDPEPRRGLRRLPA